MARGMGMTNMIIAIVDGLGGGIGAQIVGQMRQALPEQEILALGTNAIATEKMLKAGASRGASGEITPAIAEAVAGAPGRKLLLPINQPHFEIVGIEAKPLAQQIAAAVEIVRRAIGSPPHP